MSYKGEYLNNCAERIDLLLLRKVKEKLEEELLLNSLNDDCEKSFASDDEVDKEKTKKQFDEFIQKKGRLSSYRKSVFGEVNISEIVDNTEYNKTKKTKEDIEIILNSIKNSFLFNSFTSKNIHILADSFTQKEVEEGETICKQWDIGDELFIVKSGVLECFIYKNDKIHINFENNLEKNNDGELLNKNNLYNDLVKIKEYSKGELFGEIAIMYNTKRMTTIISKTKSTLWVLKRSNYEKLIRNLYM